MPDYGLLSGVFCLFGEQEFVKSTVQTGKITQFLVGDQIHFFESSVEHLEPAKIAMVQHEVSQKTGRDFRARHAATLSNTVDGRVQTAHRQFPVLLD